MFGIGVPELVIILVVALIIFGPGKLPEIGGALGKGIRDFRKSMESVPDNSREDQKIEANAEKKAEPHSAG